MVRCMPPASISLGQFIWSAEGVWAGARKPQRAKEVVSNRVEFESLVVMPNHPLRKTFLVGRAILPAAGFQPALAASKGGCGQDWPPHKSKLTHYRNLAMIIFHRRQPS